jgi:hypothetical protein
VAAACFPISLIQCRQHHRERGTGSEMVVSQVGIDNVEEEGIAAGWRVAESAA